MKALVITDEDINDRREEYMLALRTETEASTSTREIWRKMIQMFTELLAGRKEERRGAANIR